MFLALGQQKILYMPNRVCTYVKCPLRPIKCHFVAFLLHIWKIVASIFVLEHVAQIVFSLTKLVVIVRRQIKMEFYW